MLDWIRFGLTTLLTLAGLFLFAVGVLGQFRLHYVLNRMHAASMGDSLGLLCVLTALCVGSGDGWLIVKYLLVALFLWLTSPTASHLIARLEVATDDGLDAELERVDLTGGRASAQASKPERERRDDGPLPEPGRENPIKGKREAEK